MPDRKVFVREVTGGWNTTLVTGRKAQYGDFSDDVGGLQPSTYIVKPMDIDDQVQVQINPGDYVLIEFCPAPAGELDAGANHPGRSRACGPRGRDARSDTHPGSACRRHGVCISG